MYGYTASTRRLVQNWWHSKGTRLVKFSILPTWSLASNQRITHETSCLITYHEQWNALMCGLAKLQSLISFALSSWSGSTSNAYDSYFFHWGWVFEDFVQHDDSNQQYVVADRLLPDTRLNMKKARKNQLISYTMYHVKCKKRLRIFHQEKAIGNPSVVHFSIFDLDE